MVITYLQMGVGFIQNIFEGLTMGNPVLNLEIFTPSPLHFIPCVKIQK